MVGYANTLFAIHYPLFTIHKNTSNYVLRQNVSLWSCRASWIDGEILVVSLARNRLSNFDTNIAEDF
jgi:hypothetical protein